MLHTYLFDRAFLGKRNSFVGTSPSGLPLAILNLRDLHDSNKIVLFFTLGEALLPQASPTLNILSFPLMFGPIPLGLFIAIETMALKLWEAFKSRSSLICTLFLQGLSNPNKGCHTRKTFKSTNWKPITYRHIDKKFKKNHVEFPTLNKTCKF